MKVLIIAPHADDEMLGAGGTLLRLKEEGHETFLLNIANTSREYGYNLEIVNRRDAQSKKVAELLQLDGFEDLKLNPAKLEIYSRGEIIEKISETVKGIKPEMLIIPFCNDIHQDHKIVFEACLPFTKSFRYPYIKKVIMMEVLSETDFVVGTNRFMPNYFVDITSQMSRKKEILKVYKEEVPERDFPRSIEAIENLASLRGNIANVKYAEAFEILKWIE